MPFSLSNTLNDIGGFLQGITSGATVKFTPVSVASPVVGALPASVGANGFPVPGVTPAGAAPSSTANWLLIAAAAALLIALVLHLRKRGG